MKKTNKKKIADNDDEGLLLGLAADEIEIALMNDDDAEDCEEDDESPM